jgi:hypothetical protein
MKRWFFEKINKSDKPLTKVTKERGKRSKLIKLEMKREKLSRDSWRKRWVKTSEQMASPGHNDTSLKNGDQEEEKGREEVKK